MANHAAVLRPQFALRKFRASPLRNGLLAPELSGMGFHKIEDSEIFERALIATAMIIFAGYIVLFNL